MGKKTDMRMENKALRLGWDIPAKVKSKILKKSIEAVDADNPRISHLAIKNIISMENQNINLYKIDKDEENINKDINIKIIYGDKIDDTTTDGVEPEEGKIDENIDDKKPS